MSKQIINDVLMALVCMLLVFVLLTSAYACDEPGYTVEDQRMDCVLNYDSGDNYLDVAVICDTTTDYVHYLLDEGVHYDEWVESGY